MAAAGVGFGASLRPVAESEESEMPTAARVTRATSSVEVEPPDVARRLRATIIDVAFAAALRAAGGPL